MLGAWDSLRTHPEAGPTRTEVEHLWQEGSGAKVARASSTLRILLLSLDVGGGFLGWLAALEWTVPRYAGRGSGKVILAAAGIALGTVAVFATQRLYRSRVCASRSAELTALARSSTVVALAVAWLNGTMSLRAPAITGLVGAVTSFGLVAVLRGGYSGWLRHCRVQGHFTRRICLLGSADESLGLLRLMSEHPELGYEVVAAFGDPDDWAGRQSEVPVYRLSSDVARSVLGIGASGVFVGATAFTPDELERLVRDLGARGLHLQMSTGLSRVGCQRVRPLPLSNRLLLYVESSRPPLWLPAAKRAVDLLIASLALLAALPLLAVAAIAIKLEDGGPILYRQERVGRDGELFRLIKLRTMVAGAGEQVEGLVEFNQRDGPLFKLSWDPRVTRTGRFLRTTSIDELPQLINVLKGEMSLVGPRPSLPSEAEQFDTDLRERTSVPPGITGLWQVEARDSPSFEDYRRLDLFYIDNRSLTMDVQILVATLRVVVSRAVRTLRTGRELIPSAERPLPLAPDVDLIDHLSPVPVTEPGIVAQ